MKFNYPDNWIKNETATLEPITKYLISYPKADSIKPNIVINAVFLINDKNSFDEFAHRTIFSGIKGTNKERIKLNKYHGYSFNLPSMMEKLQKHIYLTTEEVRFVWL